MTDTAEQNFSRRLDAVSAAADAMLRSLLGDDTQPGEFFRPARLLDAMCHAMKGGTRLRPFLLSESSALFGVP